MTRAPLSWMHVDADGEVERPSPWRVTSNLFSGDWEQVPTLERAQEFLLATLPSNNTKHFILPQEHHSFQSHQKSRAKVKGQRPKFEEFPPPIGKILFKNYIHN